MQVSQSKEDLAEFATTTMRCGDCGNECGFRNIYQDVWDQYDTNRTKHFYEWVMAREAKDVCWALMSDPELTSRGHRMLVRVVARLTERMTKCWED